ncbi:uncharacterized protein LOC114523007 [Dendronephthya gigantea]|uniref:uncharacterized protein LOC114523007 n=1 Tax=Dendronephthya gigantea TaxID=151771 RepID=UPI00106BFC95|nr:uncharacterized protein LOC114523007 [Dendronephthya gigantea]
MPKSRHDSLTEEAANKLSHHLEEMPKNMRQFTSDFRALYTDQAVGGHSEAAIKFRKIRDDTRQDAMVYLKCVLPATTNFIRSVKEYFEYYEALSYDDWCELLPDILEETKTHKDLAQTVLDIHQNIMVPLKKRKDEAQVVMTEFANLQNLYNQSEGSAREKMARAIASEKQHEINKNAARIVAETLILALCKFIDGLQEVARFFQVIENELNSFKDSSEEGVDERKQSHYKIIKNSAREVKFLCVAFYGVLPDVRTDLEALPSQDTDQNYVDKWLKKILADIRSQTTLKALIGTPSVVEVKESVDTAGQSNHVPPLKNRAALLPKNTAALTPIDDPVPTSTPFDYQNPTSKCIQVLPMKNGQASTPKNDPISTIERNRPASPPVDNPVPESKNQQEKTPKSKRTKTPHDSAPLTSNNKAVTSSTEDLVERKQQLRCHSCHWRCNIM